MIKLGTAAIFSAIILLPYLNNNVYSQPAAPLTPEYLTLVQQKITPHFIYPKEAISNNWEGIVDVRVILADDGRIKDIDVAKSSGYPLLDAAAILTVKDAGPYPFPKDYNYNKQGELEIVLPVNYARPRQAAIQKGIASSPRRFASQNEAAGVLAMTTGKAPRNDEVKGPAGSSDTGSELSRFIELALENNKPTKIGLEEVKLATLKITEAQRGLFPALKVQGYNTAGEVFRVDYEERESKIQVDQPLFYGGRLGDTLNQAKTNLEITRKNYDRLKFDVTQKTEISYYNLIAARMNLAEQAKYRQEAIELLGKMEKLSSIGMLIPLEINSARSWINQLEFKIESIKHDLDMAELTFKQVLNLRQEPKVETRVIEVKAREVDLADCIAAAYKSRPEIYLSEQLVKFNDYGKKIESSKNKALTMDFTSSYGYYQGHFKTEPWASSNNWYVGVKGSLPWGASTINNSVSSEATQPRFGQTSPTKSSTISGEFNLLDGMKRVSDKKKSDIDLLRSISDLDETLKTIAFEVEDAALNYKKALLQLNTAEAEMKFRRNETEVAKARAMAGEGNLSSAMESLYSLSEAQTKYTQALANYQISLANLKKATGYGIQL